MKPLVIYMLEVLACSGVLLATYAILLERRVRFRWCRAYLLFITAAAGIIPLLRIPVWAGEVIELPATPVSTDWSATAAHIPLPSEPLITPEAVCIAVYLFGAVLIAAVMLWQVVRIRTLRRDAEITDMGTYRLVRTRHKIASFSFFGSVYLWHDTPEEELPAILMHEASHIAHLHSMERVAMECLKAALWWNPFAWIAARRLTEVEEFEADSDVLGAGYDRNSYMNTIFKQLFGYSPDIANGLRDSLTKKRFQMMTTKTHGRFALLRLAGTIPALLGLLCAFGFTSRAAVLVPAPPAEKAARAVQVNTVTTFSAAPDSLGSKETPTINVVAQDTVIYLSHKDTPTEPKPRYVVDGKETEDLSKINPADIAKRGDHTPTGVVTVFTKTATFNGLGKRVVFIVDGQEVESISTIEAKEIASMSINKEAAARAKYGDRAADGVIEIVTKQGESDRKRVEGASIHVDRQNRAVAVQSYPAGKKRRFTSEADEPFLVSETMPKFQGGDLSTYRTWVQNHIIFPQEAIAKGIEGRVIVSFIIERDGAINAIEILQTPDKLLSAEALRVLATTPADGWSPGTQGDNPVRVKYTLPIDFRQLPDEK